MSEYWSSISLKSFKGKGILTNKNSSRELSGEIDIFQLYNGRIVYKIRILGETKDFKASGSLNRWLTCNQPFRFLGLVNENQKIRVEGINPDEVIRHISEGGISLRGSLIRPGCFEISNVENSGTQIKSAICVVTNLPLYRGSTIEFSTLQAKLKLQRIPDYKKVRHLMSDLRTPGVLCQIIIDPLGEKTQTKVDEITSLLCGLLSISQRSYVDPVSTHLINQKDQLIMSKFEEPVFYYTRPFRPLIPEESLQEFVENSAEKYQQQYIKWKLGYAIDYYIQALSVSSAWPQAVGFFTALEALKYAFLKLPEKKQFERHVSRNRFKKIVDKIIDVLTEEFDEFKEIFDPSNLDKESMNAIRANIENLNRRSYKQVLKNMFDQIGINVDDTDLDRLVNLRNRIIHRGSPDLVDDSEGFRRSSKFGGLVERAILAILDYKGKFETYDQAVAIE